MVDYVRLAALAQRLITANGRTMTITLTDRTAASGTQPWRGPGTSDTVLSNIPAVVIPAELMNEEGNLLRFTDKVALIAANDVSPEVLDRFSFIDDGTERLKIRKVTPINPGAVRVLYILELET